MASVTMRRLAYQPGMIPGNLKGNEKMDSGNKNSNRKFPAYSTDQLEKTIADLRAGKNPAGYSKSDACMMIIAMSDEVSRRKAGMSKPFKTPQI